MDNEQLEKLIVKTRYHHLGDRTCICIATLSSGWEITGHSACADPAQYDNALGEKYALEDVLIKLEPLETYYKHEYEHRRERIRSANDRAERGVLGTMEK